MSSSKKSPTSHPIKNVIELKITMTKKRYSTPKLFIPKENGKATVAPNRLWYVSFYWRSTAHGRLDKKYTYTRGINRYKTVSERKRVGKALRDAYSVALARGWDPSTKSVLLNSRSNTKILSLREAMDRAIEIKKTSLKKSTLENYTQVKNKFMQWCEQHHLASLDVTKFSIDHFYTYLDYLRFEHRTDQGHFLTGTSVNNLKRTVSALFTVLKNERYISHNFIKGIPNVDQDPVNNKAFTYDELEKIIAHLKENNPYLLKFIAFMMYPLLRPREIGRLRVKDINTEDWYLRVETKTEHISYRRIIDKMKPVLQDMDIDNAPDTFFLFSPNKKPAPWDTITEKGKVTYFGKQFRPVKKHFGFGREYGLYSFRHTAIMDLYLTLRKKGVSEREIIHTLMPITQHKTESGLRNYLRNLDPIMPEDHSDFYSISI